VPLCPAVIAAFKAAGAALPADWQALAGAKTSKARERHFQAYRASVEYRDFIAAYRRWVAEVVVPLVGDPDGVVFQCPPTVRVVPPSARAVGKPHKDADYVGHEDAEINFWVPLTRVFGANTLQVESAPGAADFSAVELEPGQALRFNGARCSHHTLPNTTDATRVSFDFRLIPRTFWHDNFARKIGDYGCELALPAEAAACVRPREGI
jgi:ectoine hydroxylase-related dioxygenase (phytanoyl-CoA dioxygenase family)